MDNNYSKKYLIERLLLLSNVQIGINSAECENYHELAEMNDVLLDVTKITAQKMGISKKEVDIFSEINEEYFKAQGENISEDYPFLDKELDFRFFEYRHFDKFIAIVDKFMNDLAQYALDNKEDENKIIFLGMETLARLKENLCRSWIYGFYADKIAKRIKITQEEYVKFLKERLRILNLLTKLKTPEGLKAYSIRASYMPDKDYFDNIFDDKEVKNCIKKINEKIDSNEEINSSFIQNNLPNINERVHVLKRNNESDETRDERVKNDYEKDLELRAEISSYKKELFELLKQMLADELEQEKSENLPQAQENVQGEVVSKKRVGKTSSLSGIALFFYYLGYPFIKLGQGVWWLLKKIGKFFANIGKGIGRIFGGVAGGVASGVGSAGIISVLLLILAIGLIFLFIFYKRTGAMGSVYDFLAGLRDKVIHFHQFMTWVGWYSNLDKWIRDNSPILSFILFIPSIIGIVAVFVLELVWLLVSGVLVIILWPVASVIAGLVSYGLPLLIMGGLGYLTIRLFLGKEKTPASWIVTTLTIIACIIGAISPLF